MPPAQYSLQRATRPGLMVVKRWAGSSHPFFHSVSLAGRAGVQVWTTTHAAAGAAAWLVVCCSTHQNLLSTPRLACPPTRLPAARARTSADPPASLPLHSGCCRRRRCGGTRYRGAAPLAPQRARPRARTGRWATRCRRARDGGRRRPRPRRTAAASSRQSCGRRPKSPTSRWVGWQGGGGTGGCG